MLQNFTTQFQEMLDYRKEHPITPRKTILEKYRLLYRIVSKNELKIISISRNFIGYSEVETMALTLQPFFSYYKKCLKSLSNRRAYANNNYSIFSANYPIYRLKASQGILLIEIGGLNPILYLLYSLCSAILHSNSVVFYIKGYPKQFSDILRRICELLFDKRNICCLDEAELPLNVLKQCPFNQIYSFTDNIRLKSLALPKLGSEDRFHFVIVDKKCEIAEAAREIFYANAVNAGRSIYNPDLVFVNSKIYPELKARLLKIAKEPAKGHNISRINSSENFEKAEKILNYFEKNDYRILNPQAPINKNPITLYFPPIFLEKLDLKNYSDVSLKERLLNPILPLIRYENIEPIIKFLSEYSYRYKITIFSQQRSLINEIIHRADGDLYYLNDIFSSSMPRITSLPVHYAEDLVDSFASYKYVIMKRQNKLQEKLINPPLYKMQEKYLKFQIFMRKIKQNL